MITGVLTGFIISHWMAWFSSDLTCGLRGAVFGKAVAITYTLISFLTIIIFQFNQGLTITLIIISSMILFGGLMAGKLSVPKKEPKPFVLKKIIPPPKLMLFALVGYAAMALASELVALHTSTQPLLFYILITLYLLFGFVLGPYIDRHGRYYLFIIAFFFSGLAFCLLW